MDIMDTMDTMDAMKTTKIMNNMIIMKIMNTMTVKLEIPVEAREQVRHTKNPSATYLVRDPPCDGKGVGWLATVGLPRDAVGRALQRSAGPAARDFTGAIRTAYEIASSKPVAHRDEAGGGHKPGAR